MCVCVCVYILATTCTENLLVTFSTRFSDSSRILPNCDIF